MSWADEELSSLSFGDIRLDRLAITLVEALAIKPETSIPDKCGTWSATIAAYRLIDNKKVTSEKLLDSHTQASIARMNKEKVVLLIEDTTQLDYTKHKSITGLGPLYQSYQRGMFLHLMLATTPERTPLGVIRAKYYIRDVKESPEGEPEEHVVDLRPFEEKESYRWFEGYQMANEYAKKTTATIVFMGDRESDIKRIHKEAVSQTAKIVIRAKHNRILESGDHLKETVLKTVPVGINQFTMPARPGHKAREVTQKLYGTTVVLPADMDGEEPYAVNVVIAEEINTPAGEEPITWMLITTLPVKTAEDIRLVIEYYLCRWDIEMFFKVLKTGCKVEELQFESVKRLQTAITLNLIVAHRILMMAKLGRETPDVPADCIFDEEEWQLAYKLRNKTKPLPTTVPRLHDVILWVAMLGGFLGRKHDGEPGTTTLWRGLSKIQNYLIIKKQLSELSQNANDSTG